jgi:ubiquinone biosynthesis protein UbiJ
MTCFLGQVAAQDIVGIENCSAEKAMDRRTGCLQANVNYLQTVISKNAADNQQKLAAANAEIAALKSVIANLQARVDQLAKAANDATKRKDDGKGK